jgi:hypothetical protein
MVHENNYPVDMFVKGKDVEDNSPELSPLESIFWPTTSDLWKNNVTPSNLSELLDSISLESYIKEIAGVFALREITAASVDGNESTGLDEEALI